MERRLRRQELQIKAKRVFAICINVDMRHAWTRTLVVTKALEVSKKWQHEVAWIR